jgi:hypothetical protein
MVASYNGWTASSSPDAINIIKTQIGEKAYVYVAAKAAPVLGYAGRYWDNFIENIDGGVWDEWGYAYREVRGGGSLSNHASGSAIDINATRYPRGRANMDSKTKAQVRAMVMKINAAAGTTVIKWGGEWFGEYTDQMHLEIAEGASADEVRWARKVLDGLPPVSVGAPTSPPHPRRASSEAARLDGLPQEGRVHPRPSRGSNQEGDHALAEVPRLRAGQAEPLPVGAHVPPYVPSDHLTCTSPTGSECGYSSWRGCRGF